MVVESWLIAVGPAVSLLLGCACSDLVGFVTLGTRCHGGSTRVALFNRGHPFARSMLAASAGVSCFTTAHHDHRQLQPRR